MSTNSRTNKTTAPIRNAQTAFSFGVDAYLGEVMQASWRRDAKCLTTDFEGGSDEEKRGWCAQCPVSEPCFWSALVEERVFRGSSAALPGIRCGVEGARRSFILRELTDTELMARYRDAVSALERVTVELTVEADGWQIRGGTQRFVTALAAMLFAEKEFGVRSWDPVGSTGFRARS